MMMQSCQLNVSLSRKKSSVGHERQYHQCLTRMWKRSLMLRHLHSRVSVMCFFEWCACLKLREGTVKVLSQLNDLLELVDCVALDCYGWSSGSSSSEAKMISV